MKSATKTHVAWLSAEQAAEYLGMGTGREAIRRFYDVVRRQGIRKHRLGRSLRFRVVDLDSAVEPEPEQVDSPLRLVGR